MNDCGVLMVTCCLDESRYAVLQQVIDNLLAQDPRAADNVTVFDNASSVPETLDLLKRFKNVWRSDRNVGYWSAIDWWLTALDDDRWRPRYTYVIESDMMHYDLAALHDCVDFLDRHPELGSMRLHEYSVENAHLYNKDAPRPDSRSGLWQSHTNKVSGAPIGFKQVEGRFWATNFLTQLPALNRYDTMKAAFDELAARGSFTELDFQRLCFDRHPQIAIIDGGIFNCDLNQYGSKVITGSWTDPQELQRLGYTTTRVASIVPRGQYAVTKL